MMKIRNSFLGALRPLALGAPARWIVDAAGHVFAFGDAPYLGGIVPFGNGYLMVAADGGIFNFSDRPFLGSLGGTPPANPIVAVAALDR